MLVSRKSADHDNEWHAVLPKLNLGGMALQLAEHCLLESLNAEQVVLLLDHEGSNLRTSRTEEQLLEALTRHLGTKPRLSLKLAEMPGETPGQRRIRVGQEIQQRAEAAIGQDPFVRQLQERFGAVIVPGSVRPQRNTNDD